MSIPVNEIEVINPIVINPNSKKMSTDLSKLSDEDFQVEMKRREAIKQEKKQAQKQAYLDLKDETIVCLSKDALMLHNRLKEFKNTAFEAMQAYHELLLEYSGREADEKKSFKIENETFKILYQRQGKGTFDERADQAEKHIIDFVNKHFQSDKDTQDFIFTLLERNKGELDINSVQKLYAMEDRFEDENWKKGISLLKESYTYSHSKDYIRFQEKDEKGVWQTINLQFSSI